LFVYITLKLKPSEEIQDRKDC